VADIVVSRLLSPHVHASVLNRAPFSGFLFAYKL
jgi:hypothetical protein